jgi:CheY-like chemotaxis protein
VVWHDAWILTHLWNLCGQCLMAALLPVTTVLDVMLPGVQGFEVLRWIRAHSRIPILMLTARGETFDRILGLELGADDYLPKPFDPRELAAMQSLFLKIFLWFVLAMALVIGRGADPAGTAL